MAAHHLSAADLEEQSDDDAYAGYWKQVAMAYGHRTTDASLSAPYDQKDIGCGYHDLDENDGELCWKSMFKYICYRKQRSQLITLQAPEKQWALEKDTTERMNMAKSIYNSGKDDGLSSGFKLLSMYTRNH